MGSLDDKLDELSIWIEANRDVSPRTWEDEIWPLIKEKFKQAFISSGWVQVPKEALETWHTYNHMAGFMTGSEWYDRFEKEIRYVGNADFNRSTLEAAKKASGLVGEEQ